MLLSSIHKSRTLPNTVLEAFDTHASELKAAAKQRKKMVRIGNIVEDNGDKQETDSHMLGKRTACDKFDGCINRRTLRTLLTMIDERGFERCFAAMS